MRILLLDETSAAERFSSDQNKNAMLGSGVGSGRLTTNIAIFANASGIIADLRCIPLSVKPSFGTASVPYLTEVSVSTTAGKQPVVVVSRGHVNERDDGAGGCITDQREHFALTGTAIGSFSVVNNTDSSCGPFFGEFPDVGTESTFYCYI